MKIVADKKSDLVLGVHIVGTEASDIVSVALGVEMGRHWKT